MACLPVGTRVDFGSSFTGFGIPPGQAPNPQNTGVVKEIIYIVKRDAVKPAQPAIGSPPGFGEPPSPFGAHPSTFSAHPSPFGFGYIPPRPASKFAVCSQKRGGISSSALKEGIYLEYIDKVIEGGGRRKATKKTRRKNSRLSRRNK